MPTFAVLATGPSLTAEQVERVRHLRVIAVNDAFRLAPWAEALAAQDIAWWRANPDALEFAGRRFSCFPLNSRVEQVETNAHINTGTNSGLLGIELARRLGATRILLLGFDHRGGHFFGRHDKPKLKNTEDLPQGYGRQHRQFEQWAKRQRVEVINCTPGSALRVFPMGSLDACLAEPAD